MAEIQIKSEVTGAVWKIEKIAGDDVADGDTVMIIESMKMEIPVLADGRGRLKSVLVKEGEPVQEGQPVAILEEG